VNVSGRKCVIVDDLASTCSTLVAAAKTLFNLGAKVVQALFPHPAMNVGAEERIMGIQPEHLLTSDPVPRATQPRLQTI
jgi:ribose-phosphate pyrophosphokinase